MSASTCLADRDDGTPCRAPATILDHQRGGMVCRDHDLNTDHYPSHGICSRRRGEVRQAELDEICLYVCRACGQIADPIWFAGRTKDPRC
jgi:hypothetical protein